MTTGNRRWSNPLMVKSAKKGETFPPKSMRLDPDLLYRAEKLALENKRAGLADRTTSKVVNTALAEYLKGKRGA